MSWTWDSRTRSLFITEDENAFPINTSSPFVSNNDTFEDSKNSLDEKKSKIYKEKMTRQGLLKARKEHKCLYCGKIIFVGSEYFRVTFGEGIPKAGPYCNEQCVGQASWKE